MNAAHLIALAGHCTGDFARAMDDRLQAQSHQFENGELAPCCGAFLPFGDRLVKVRSVRDSVIDATSVQVCSCRKQRFATEIAHRRL
jgi:hypothetical protein